MSSTGRPETQRVRAAVAELGRVPEHDLRGGVAERGAVRKDGRDSDDVLSDARAFYRRLMSQPLRLAGSVDSHILSGVYPERSRRAQDDRKEVASVILSPSPSVILSAAKNLSFRLRVNSAKNPMSRDLQPPRASRLVLDRALAYRGTPYRWGGASREGLDCSGLVLRALSDLGLRAPHSAALLFGLGQAVETSGLLPGDLVFFRNTYKPGISHVGIVEQGSHFIHASSAAGQVTIGDLGRPYFRARYAGARRIAADRWNWLAAQPDAQPENTIAAPLRLGLPDLPH
jgi:hypothetical protein